MNKNGNTFTIRLTNAVTRVDLPYTVKYSKVKVLSMRYVSTGTNEFVLINIPDFNHGNTFFDGMTTKAYTRWIPLNPTSNTWHYYENQANNFFDYVRDEPIEARSFTVECMINGVYDSEIQMGNPLYLELRFE